ncbi:cell division protein ZapB [bacterium]|nr:cell division protein ZapB [bacterium]
MDSNLSALEAKVLEAVELIKELRGENQRLANRNGELEARCEELEGRVGGLEDDNTRLTEEIAEARQMADSAGDFEEKRKEIEDKVGGLLSKLEALG